MKGTYSKLQQIHSLSLLSNAALGRKFNCYNDLQSYVHKVIDNSMLNTSIQKCIGKDWQIIWGPAIFCANSSTKQVIADKTIMLLYNPMQNVFTIAIAGAYKNSIYGWFEEDFNINTTVKWREVIDHPQDILDTATISTGVYNGLQTLLNIKHNELTLMQVLSIQLLKAKKRSELALTGHGLGGALASTLAMYLKDTQKKWDTSKKVFVISAYPTGTTTPGNEAFANRLSSNIDYHSFYNRLDVVPHAWQEDLLVQVPHFYSDYIADSSNYSLINPLIGVFCASAMLNTVCRNYKYSALKINYQQAKPFVALAGTFDTESDYIISQKLSAMRKYMPAPMFDYFPVLENFIRFLWQMGFQHQEAYYSLLNIVDFANTFREIKNKILPIDEERMRLTAIRNTVKTIAGYDLNIENEQAVAVRMA